MSKYGELVYEKAKLLVGVILRKFDLATNKGIKPCYKLTW